MNAFMFFVDSKKIPRQEIKESHDFEDFGKPKKEA